MTEVLKTFEELRDYLYEEKQHACERLVENLEELTPFQLGRIQGAIGAWDEILNVLRNTMKYGDVE